MHPGVPRPTGGGSGAAWITRLRLASGLVLFTYLTTHFANHALGLVSLEAMEDGRVWFHTGLAVVGRMGYAEAVYLTAVGDTVHVASRLEGLTKEYDCQLVISEQVARRAGVDVAAFPPHELNLRGRVERLAIRVIPEAQRLADAIAGGQAPGSPARSG